MDKSKSLHIRQESGQDVVRKSCRLLQMIQQYIGPGHRFKAVHTKYLFVGAAVQRALGLATAQQGADVVRIKAAED